MSDLDLLRERVYVNIPLETIFATKRSFGCAAFVDDDLIPVYARRLTVSGNGYTDVVGTSGTLYEMCRAYFQNSSSTNPLIKMPDSIEFCRLIESASSPSFVCGSHETDYSVYKLVSDGTLTVSDGVNEDDLTALDFTSVNSWADVLAVVNTAMAALTPTITGLATAVWSVDANGLLTLTNSTTGSTAEDITVEAQGTGTDVAGVTYFNAIAGSSVSGLDSESLLDGYNATKLIFDDFWGILIRGGDDTELIELARQVEGEERFLFSFEDTATATNPASSDDLASVFKGTWNLKRVASSFSYTEDYPDFGMVGGSIGCDEGSCAFGFVDLSNVLTSGQAVNSRRLTGPQRNALEAKNYNWIEAVSGFISNYPGRSVQGQEIRLMLGRDWISSTIAAMVYTARIQRRILGFDNDSLTVYEEIVTAVLTEARDKRNILQSFVITMPTEDDFTPADKEDHTIELDVFNSVVVTDAWRYEITGRMTFGA